MPRPSKASLKQQFISITETNQATASLWLDKYKWKLDDAMNAYLSSGGHAADIDGTTNGASTSSTSKIDPSLLSIYEKYHDPKYPDKIDIDGTVEYLESLGFDPEDIISLTLSYFLDSPSTGVFTKQSFLSRWSDVGATSIPQMKQFLIEYQQKVDADLSEFEKIYKFTFDFIKANEIDRVIGYDLAGMYWRLLLGSRKEFKADDVWQRLEQWFEFVDTVYKRDFSKDSWNMFYYFVKDVVSQDPTDFSGYDEMSAWPSVIDEYVEYLKDKQLLKDDHADYSI